MKVEFKARHALGIVLGLFVAILNIIFMRGQILFWPMMVVAFSFAWATFWIDFISENKRQKELERRFPEFVRNLVGAIKSGMPASTAVIHVSKTDYGDLSPYITKLANQLEWSYPFHKTLQSFARNTGNSIIKRAISTVIEAERSGGNMEDVLESITNSLIEIKNIKLSREASIHSQLVQSYIIFFVFLSIMIVIQNVLVPYIGSFSEASSGSVTGDNLFNMMAKVSIDFSSPINFFYSLGGWFVSFHGILLMLAMFQGFFAGLVMGKLADGDIKSGLKHSIILITLAFFVITL